MPNLELLGSIVQSVPIIGLYTSLQSWYEIRHVASWNNFCQSETVDKLQRKEELTFAPAAQPRLKGWGPNMAHDVTSYARQLVARV
jgi:hypothetical protein